MSDIAINPVTRRVQFTGNTGTGPYAFTFNILVDGDIAVFKGTTELTLTTDYTVSINANGTGSITLTVALIASDVLTIIGGRELSRTTDFVTAGDLLASSLNEQLDSNVIMTQQLDEKLGRGLFVNPGDVFTDLELPLKDDRKGTVLGFNATTGDPEPGPEIADVDSLANISADIKTLAEIQDGTVATDAITNVNTIRANVTTVSNISGNVTTVAGISSDVTTVAADGADIGTVAGISSDVTTVSGISANVTSVAGNASNINTVAADGADIGTVAASIADVNTAADNITEIQNASANAATATTQAGIATTQAGIATTKASEASTSAATATTQAGISTTKAAESAASAAAALASKNAAATSESNASTSESNASNSATLSEASRIASVAAQAASETAETNAETAQTAAEAAQTAAETAETNAATSETNAASSAASASTDAGTATTKAGEAAASATASANSATASEAAKDATLAALDNFDDRYLGAKASDPTVDNDGNPLISGALYFNTTDDVMKVYEGSQWVAAYASLSGALLVNNNLSDVADAAASRTNLGLGTAATSAATDFVAVTGDTMTGNLDVQGTVSADGLTVDGNVGIGVSPSAWSTFNALEMSNGVYLGSYTGGTTAGYLGTNNYFNGSNFIYKNSDFATRYQQVDGKHQWFSAPSGTAGNAISFTQAMTLDASGNVGIGTSSPDSSLHVLSTTLPQLKIDYNGTYYSTISNNGALNVVDPGTNNKWVFLRNGTEQMRIDSSGNVGIGTSSPSNLLHLYKASGGNYSIIENTSGKAAFGVGSSGEVTISAESASNPIRFLTSSGGAERMRIDSSGNLLVGKTATNYQTVGVEAKGNGSLWATADGNGPLVVTRKTSDGTLADFYKNTTKVGSIGVDGSHFEINTEVGTGALSVGGSRKFQWANTIFYPLNDNSADLGHGSYRFRDAHFSGTVNAANFNTTSDATLKTNVETLTGSLDAVKSLRGVSFDWLENGNSEVGVIAQEVEAVLPDVVSTNDQGIKSVKYGNMVALLIEAMKEQQAQIDELKAKLGE